MATKDRDEVYMEMISDKAWELSRYIEGLEEKINELDRKKKDLVDMRIILDEMSMKFYHHLIDTPEKEEDEKKKLNEFTSELSRIKEEIGLVGGGEPNKDLDGIKGELGAGEVVVVNNGAKLCDSEETGEGIVESKKRVEVISV